MALAHSYHPSRRATNAGWRVINGQRLYLRSRWEANYGFFLAWLKKNGAISSWEHEPKTFWFKGIKRGTCSYLPDFCITENNGSQVYIEVKGYMSAKDKTKIKRFKKYFPKEKLFVVDGTWFKRNNAFLKRLVPGWETEAR